MVTYEAQVIEVGSSDDMSQMTVGFAFDEDSMELGRAFAAKLGDRVRVTIEAVPKSKKKSK